MKERELLKQFISALDEYRRPHDYWRGKVEAERALMKVREQAKQHLETHEQNSTKQED